MDAITLIAIRYKLIECLELCTPYTKLHQCIKFAIRFTNRLI